MSKPTTDDLLALVRSRRSIYNLTKSLGDVTPARIQHILRELTLHTPSAFNSQSTRVLLLLGAEHDKLWDMTASVLEPVVGPDAFPATERKLAGFRDSGAGTVLFFEDQDTVHAHQEKFRAYADKFPEWAAQSDGMQQYLTWAALEAEGLGANLQHYNPLIDERVAAEWGVPAGWKLSAQLVFGGVAGPAGDKTFKPVEERMMVAGAERL